MFIVIQKTKVDKYENVVQHWQQMLNYAKVLPDTRSKKKIKIVPIKLFPKAVIFQRKERVKQKKTICMSRRSLIVFSIFTRILPTEQRLQMIIICNQRAKLLLFYLFFHSKQGLANMLMKHLRNIRWLFFGVFLFFLQTVQLQNDSAESPIKSILKG